MDSLRTEVCGQQKQSNDPHNYQHNPQCTNYWAPLTRKRHIPPHPAQPRHTNDGAPRTRKQHQQEHRPQRPTERSDPTQHAEGRTGDCPGPRKGATTRRTVTRGGGGGDGRRGGDGGVPQRGRLFKFDFPSATFWVKIYFGRVGLRAKSPLPPSYKQTRLACRGAVAFVFLGCLPNRPNGGCRLLPKRAKKHSIAADCGELKATFGPRLRCAAVQQVKQ